MHRLLGVFLAFLLLVGGVSVAAEEIPDAMALLELGSAAEGSTLNYYTLRVVMQYCNAEGVCVGTMFDGVVLSHPRNTDSREKADTYLSEVAGASGIFSVAEQLAAELAEGGFTDEAYVYPFFVSFPNASGFDISDAEKEEFCNYYIDSLVLAVESENYSHIALVGVYFDDSYSGNLSFKNYCMSLVKAKGLLVIESTSGDKDALADRAYSCYGGKAVAEGAELYLSGVPTAEDGRVLVNFLDQVYAVPQGKSVLYTFEAFNNLYDCAIALDQNEPNSNARQTYDCIKSVLKGDTEATRQVYDALKKAAENKNSNSDEEKSKTDIGIIICAIIIALGLAYLIFTLFGKDRLNGRRRKKKQ